MTSALPTPNDPEHDDSAPPGAQLLRSALLDVVLQRGYEHRDVAFTLSSGGTSHDYVDMRRAVARGADLLLAAEAVLAQLNETGWEFDAIGGMTMGADPVAHVAAVLGGRSWYSVRKAEKDHGTGRRIEGSTVEEGTRVVVFEDTVSTGRSLLEALDVVEATGATVVGAITILDRGDDATAAFAARGVAYQSLLTYDDLGIVPLGGSAQTSAS
jgi:orotate phosphoribosyltransferase